MREIRLTCRDARLVRPKTYEVAIGYSRKFSIATDARTYNWMLAKNPHWCGRTSRASLQVKRISRMDSSLLSPLSSLLSPYYIHTNSTNSQLV